jgi:nucleoside-triphosphatase THEP1
MEDSKKYYIEIAVGHVGNRGIIIPRKNLSQKIEPESHNAELYNSYYTFDEELVEHFKVFKTIRGFRGKYYLEKVILDIDKGINTEKQLLDNVRYLVSEELVNNFGIEERQIGIWFSGNGFHIEFPDLFGFTPDHNLPKEVKQTLGHHFPTADNIYDGARIIRTGFTYNTKSGLFKTPFDLKEIFNQDMDYIKKHSEGQRTNFEEFKYTPVISDPNDIPLSKYKIIVETEPVVDQPIAIKDNPSSFVTCMQKVYNEGPVQGSRHLKLLRMASAFRRHGIPKTAVTAAMQSWAVNMEPYEVQITVEDTFKHGYRYGCDDTIMKEYCDPKCIFYKRKDFTLEVLDNVALERQFSQFIRSDYEKKAINLARLYNCQDFWFYPGELIIVSGDTGLGKTAFVQNLIQKLFIMDPILFLSLEVSAKLIYRRSIQIAHGMNKEEVIGHYKENPNTLSESVKHIRVMQVAPEIKAINQLVAEIEPKLLVIDTSDMIEVDGYGDELNKQNKIINKLKGIAQTRDTIIIAVHHLNKEGARSMNPNLWDLKGSTNVVQKADKVLLLTGEREAPWRLLKTLKARDEGNMEIKFKMDFNTFQFIQLEDSFEQF